jgi:hypothetical protein
MQKDFKFKNSEGRLVIQRCFFGIGAGINFVNPCFSKQILFVVYIDFLIVRFWFNFYKK